MSDKKRRYRFTEKAKSKGGKQSVIFAAVSFGLFLIDTLISFFSSGKAGSVAGIIVMVAMAFAVYGFYVGMKSFSEEKEVSLVYPVIGTLGSGIMAVCYLTLFLSGI